jgi:hypothetical protein
VRLQLLWRPLVGLSGADPANGSSNLEVSSEGPYERPARRGSGRSRGSRVAFGSGHVLSFRCRNAGRFQDELGHGARHTAAGGHQRPREHCSASPVQWRENGDATEMHGRSFLPTQVLPRFPAHEESIRRARATPPKWSSPEEKGGAGAGYRVVQEMPDGAAAPGRSPSEMSRCGRTKELNDDEHPPCRQAADRP